jgi:hypothetical protein
MTPRLSCKCSPGSTSTYSRSGGMWFTFACYSRTRMAKRKKKKIDLSREFYERHEWIQRNIAERLELHRKLRAQRAQEGERD